jgi:hypothetical protein
VLVGFWQGDRISRKPRQIRPGRLRAHFAEFGIVAGQASPMSDGCLFFLKRREISGPLIYKGIASRVMVRRQFFSPMSLVHRQHRFL